MAKLNRERRLRERRQDKQAKKDARKQASSLDPGGSSDALTGETDESARPDVGPLTVDAVARARTDA